MNAKISHVQKRKIQAPFVSKILYAFIEEFGKDKTIKVLEKIIREDAIESGCSYVKLLKSNSITDLVEVIEKYWCEDDAMEIEVLKKNDKQFHFNVTACKYADIYKDLDCMDLGLKLSCLRDWHFNTGFNPDIKFNRTKTIMEGCDICDFRYDID